MQSPDSPCGVDLSSLSQGETGRVKENPRQWALGCGESALNTHLLTPPETARALWVSGHWNGPRIVLGTEGSPA